MAWRVGGLTIRASPWLLPVVAAAVLAGCGRELVWCLLLLLAHELAHLVAASAVGLQVEELEIWPLGGRLQVQGLDRDPACEALVALAGPLHNLVLLGLATAVSSIGGVTTPGVRLFVSVNLSLALVNLLPFPPLDGGRALVAVLGSSVGRRRARAVAAGAGQVFAGALIIAGGVATAVTRDRGVPVSLLAAGLLLLGATVAESRRSGLGPAPLLDLVRKRRLGDRRPRRLIVLSVPASTGVADLCRDLSSHRSYLVWVLDGDGRAAGPLTEADLLRGLMEEGWDVTAGDLATPRS